MTHPPAPSGSHIAEARKRRDAHARKHSEPRWSQTRLAKELAAAGYGVVVSPARISQIEGGASIDPRMVAPLLQVLPELAAPEPDAAGDAAA